MDQAEPSQLGQQPKGEEPIQEGLIDRMFVLSAAFALASLLVAQIRATRIGWSARDLIQAAVVLVLIGSAMARGRVGTGWKAPLLVTIYVVGGMSGFATLGMLGGTVFLLPLAMIVIALLYSPRATVAFAMFIVLLCSGVAHWFCTAPSPFRPGHEALMGAPLHWAVYIGCLLLFSGVACTTIQEYRQHVRMLVGQLGRQRDQLVATNADLTAALADVRRLSGLIPICSACKRIRGDTGYWEQVDSYIHDHSEAQFTHGLCPDCMRRLYPDISEDELEGHEE